LPVLENQSGFFLPLVRLSAARALAQTNGLAPELVARLLPFEADEAVRDVLASHASASASVAN
jgi:hypothetical protein